MQSLIGPCERVTSPISKPLKRWVSRSGPEGFKSYPLDSTHYSQMLTVVQDIYATKDTPECKSPPSI